ncbi:MAG: outer membrane lipoprotein chaperone LolA [Pseudomonadota bacterium]
MRQVLACLVILSVAAFAPALADDAADGEALLQRFLDEVETLEGSFEQSVIDADGDVLDVSSGSLKIARPGRFRWGTAEPYEQWLIADGRNVWSYDVDLAQVTVKPQSDALSNTPALLLGGGADALDEFVVDGTSSDSAITWVRLTPRDTSSGFRRVELGFSGGELARMVFLDNLEQQTVVILSDLKVNGAVKDSEFEFVVPDDVDVVGTPAVASAP